MCNIVHAYLRRDLLQALALSTGKEREKALKDFDDWLNGPIEGWDAMDRRLQQELQRP